MTTSTANQKVTLDVPKPWTKLEVGAGTIGGVYIETDEHVRLIAHGSASESHAIATAIGQLWVQAVQDVVVVAKKKAMITSQTATLMHSAKTLTVLAGFKPSSVASETTPGTLPTGVDEYDSAASVASAFWTGFGAATAAVTAVAGIAQMALGTGFSWTSTVNAAINIGATLVGSMAVGWQKDGKFPGVNLFSQGGTYIGCTFGATYIVGMTGTVLAAPFLSAFSLLMGKNRGFKKSSLMSCGSVDISSLFGNTHQAAKDTTISARTGDLNFVAPTKIRIGTPNRPPTAISAGGTPWPVAVTGRLFFIKKIVIPNPQKVTSTIAISAVKEAGIDALLGIAYEPAFGFRATAATDVTLKAKTNASLLGFTQILEVGATLVGMGGASRGALDRNEGSFFAGFNAVELKGSEYEAAVTFKPSGIVFGDDSAQLKVTPAGVQIKGNAVKIE